MLDNRSNESNGGLPGLIRQGITNYMKDVHTCLPGKILEFNPEKQIAKVQLLIKRIFKEDRVLDLPPLINVIVWQPKAGGYSITFPIKPDDECLVLFSERSLDAWYKSGQSKKPTNYRMHSFSDAICLVGMSSEPNVITDYDPDNLQIRNSEKDQTFTMLANKDINITTGTVSFELINEGEEVKINAPSKMTVTSPETEFTGNVTIAGTTTMQSDASVDGNIDITGISSAADHDSDGISGKEHIHAHGTPNTGPPQ